jgi:hypothetical protein
MLDELAEQLGLWRPILCVLFAWCMVALASSAPTVAFRFGAPVAATFLLFPANIMVGWAVLTEVGPDLAIRRFGDSRGDAALLVLLGWTSVKALGLANLLFPAMVAGSLLRGNWRARHRARVARRQWRWYS